MKNFNRLYIHIPFCKSKCSYCQFYSIPNPEQEDFKAYLNKIKTDVKNYKYRTNPLKSIFLGGGTPSFLPNPILLELFQIIYNNFEILQDAEISVECNPDSLTSENISILSDFASRISIGIQSFSPYFRNKIGRRTTFRQLDETFKKFSKRSLKNFSIDLIYGIPGQTINDWEKDLHTAANYPISHLSAYSLTLEEGNKLVEDKNSSTNELQADMWLITNKILSKYKIKQYEISNYSIDNNECRHNLAIWYGDTYLGLGPTASSFDGIKRWTEPSFYEWLSNKKPIIDMISFENRKIEIFIMGLRTLKGWNIKEKDNKKIIFSQYNFLEIDKSVWNKLFKKLNKLKEEGLISIIKDTEHSNIKATKQGLLFWDNIGMELI